MVPGFTSPTFTPPEVTMASATGLGPETDRVKCFSSCKRARRCSFLKEFALSSGSICSRVQSTGTMLVGTSDKRTFSMLRLLCSRSSRKSRSSSFSSERAGFRSIDSE